MMMHACIGLRTLGINSSTLYNCYLRYFKLNKVLHGLFFTIKWYPDHFIYIFHATYFTLIEHKESLQ
jgi:hypothetical protein